MHENLFNSPNFSIYINSQANTKNLNGQNKNENKMLNPGSYQCYKTESQKAEKKKKKGDNLKKELLNFPSVRSRSIELVHRSRSNEECASRLEDDDDDGDEAAEDSAPC